MANVGFVSVQQGERHGASPSSAEGPLLMYPFWEPQWQRRCLHQPKAAVSGRAGQDSGVRLNSIRALSSSYLSGLDLLLLVGTCVGTTFYFHVSSLYHSLALL